MDNIPWAVGTPVTKEADPLWIDINTGVSLNLLPDRITDVNALKHSSLFNLLNCTPGQRSRTFQPEYGSYWLQFIHEPVNWITASKMETTLIMAIKRWEPRVRLNTADTRIAPDLNLPGYRIRLAFELPFQTLDTMDFTLKL